MTTTTEKTKPLEVREILDKRDLERFPRWVDESVLDMSEGRSGHKCVMEISDFTSKQEGNGAGPGLRVPFSALSLGRNGSNRQTRALDPGTGSTGGYLVGSEVGPAQFALRPWSVVMSLVPPQNVIEGLKSNYSLPRELPTELTSFGWYPSQALVTSNDGNFGQTAFTPHRASGAQDVSKELLRQAPQSESFILESAKRSLGVLIDQGFLTGDAQLGAPLGAYYAAPKTVTFSGAATLAKAVNFQRQSLDANARLFSLAYVAHQGVREKWQTVQEFSGSSLPLWHNDESISAVKAYVSQSMAAGNILLGDFSTGYVCFFSDSIEILADPYDGSKAKAKINYLVTAYCDVGTTHPETFVKNADSAVQ